MRASLTIVMLTLPGVAAAQGDSQATRRPLQERAVTTQYDSVANATELEVVLERGRYLMFSQRPKVTASLNYTGRSPSSWPDTIYIKFTTQAPQYIRSASMLITTTDGYRVAALSSRSVTKQRAFTVDHTVTFPVPIEELRPLLESTDGLMEVGGIKLRLERRHFLALAELMGQ